MKRFRHIATGLIWLIVGLYFLLVIMVHIPMIQSAIGSTVASAIATKLGAPVSVGKVDVGFFNRIIIDDVAMLDKRGKQMLWVSRLSAKFSYLDLMRGKISITSAQIFTPKLNLYKENAQAKPNFQFAIDSLASKDTTKHEPVNIAVNSLIIRHGRVSWNQTDTHRKSNFDVNHLNISDISSHIIINAIGGNLVDVNVKKLSMKEASGIDLRSLSLRAKGNDGKYSVEGLKLELPNSEVNIPQFSLLSKNGISYKGSISNSHVSLSDISPFVSLLKGIDRQAFISSAFEGSDKKLRIRNFELSVNSNRKTFSLKSPSDIRLKASAFIRKDGAITSWRTDIRQLSISDDGMELFSGKIPEALLRLKTLQYSGTVSGEGSDMTVRGDLISDAGNASVNINKTGDKVKGHVLTRSFNVAQVLADEHFGLVSADINGEGNLKAKVFSGKADIGRFDYNKYSYRNILLDGSYNNGNAEGKASVDDPNLKIDINGSSALLAKEKKAKLTADISRFQPSELHLFGGRLANANYRALIIADFIGNDVNTASGNISVRNFSMESAENNYQLDSLTVKAGHSQQGHYVLMESDFGKAMVYGNFDYASLPQSFENAIVRRLPSIANLAPLKFKSLNTNEFSLHAQVYKSDWAKPFLNIPLDIRDTVHVSAKVSSIGHSVDATVAARELLYGDYHLKNIKSTFRTDGDMLFIDSKLTNMRNDFVGTDLSLNASAGNDKLKAAISFDNHAAEQRFRGTVESDIAFGRTHEGKTEGVLNFHQSQFHVGDTLYTVHPSTVVYSKNRLEINNLEVGSQSQSLSIDGVASSSDKDSLIVNLDKVNVNYLMDLINFHSVDFAGYASGNAYVSKLFSQPDVHGNIRVDDFRLIGGRLGTLYANVDWNSELGQVDINAVARDTIQNSKSGRGRNTFVRGYVSPKRNYIDLDIGLHESRAEFIGNLCSSFLDDVDLSGNGDLRVWGDLKRINLTGDVTAHGSVRVTPLGTHYTLHHGKVHFIENEIEFMNDSIYDDSGNLGIIGGALHHQHLSHMTYDVDIEARNLLAFNFDGSDGSSFYGKVNGTGRATIAGRPGEVNINVDVTPEQGSEIVYDITSPESLSSQEFIHWENNETNQVSLSNQANLSDQSNPVDIPTDIRLSLSINATPNATLRLITDKASGDFITLNGSGALRATYFNKGGMDVFGTYTVDHGIYSITIQNIIKRTFEFVQGGTIVFGGDPYSALLNLKAQYPIASVSLADLQVGRSFSANNVRVNCLMDISGTPASPKVDFNLDFPTMSTDAKQMVFSLINGEEEMNQQVLYLLAVGRFYARGGNNAGTQSNQTSLAMQSILSGQLSQQINTVLSNVMKTNNWNFGANISTGDEGFNNAEYEGLLSGRLLNNRLLFNGQFGYRDNANATTSFIGDFDIRYLIFPNGNLSVHVYNQTNDRYFTRNSLNTQGIGFILKKDFGSLRELLGFGRKKRSANDTNVGKRR